MPRTYAEQIAPFEVLPAKELSEGKPIVARLIGRRFEQLYDGRFDRPYDPRLGKAMVKTLSHLCATLGATFGYAERNELSLFAISNGGEARRLISRICGEASGKMSLLLGEVVTYEARLYEFPATDGVSDYFLWRRDVTELQSLDVYCQHVLLSTGADPLAVPHILEGLGPDEKVELLRQNEFDFSTVPAWQRAGAGVYVDRTAEAGAQLVIDLHLPPANGDEYATYLRHFVA
jgi:tRNA(His) 5'-end guanylyltransferase